MSEFHVLSANAAQPRLLGLNQRLQAALEAFLAPERLSPSRDDRAALAHAGSVTEALALPPDWHGEAAVPQDLLTLSFLPFE